MANYKIVIKPSAVKELNKIPKKELSKITDKINSLSHDPRPSGCEKLAAQKRIPNPPGLLSNHIHY